MTVASWNPNTLTSVTLTEGQWSTIRTAVLCLSVDEGIKGNLKDSVYFMKAFEALKQAMDT